jgi:hypothetical protein
MLDAVLSNKRKKTNFKNYKEACNQLQEKEYLRGSKEKEVQIKRWETDLNIFKNKDNSFTYINEAFKDQKKIRKEKRIERDTVYIDNHSVFLGAGKYKFERFNNMRDVFLKIIDNTKANSKKGYLKWFYRNCQLYTMIGDEDFRRNYMNSKAKSLAIELFSGQCAYVFESFLKKCRDDLRIYMTYYDEYGNDIDFDSCEVAKKLAAKELDFKFMDYKLRIDELYSRINEILEENDLNWLDYRTSDYNGDPDYVEHVLSYFTGDTTNLEVQSSNKNKSVK